MEKGFFISRRGGSHASSGTPMQDYSSAVRCDDYSIAIVCDGHGSAKHFRSHIGSRLATEVIQENLIDFVNAYPNYESASKDFGKKAERLKLNILNTWISKIDEDIDKTPFTEEELKKGVGNKGVDYLSYYTKVTPYGTTALAVLLTKDYYVALMLGDGLIAKMAPYTEATEETFEGKREIKRGDPIDSMCNEDAAYKMHVKCVPVSEDEKGLAFAISSDGYCEAGVFPTWKMLNWPKKYIVRYAVRGIDEAIEAITPQFDEISAKSEAEDDISMAIACNEPELYIEWAKAEREKALKAKAEAERKAEEEKKAEAEKEATAKAETEAKEEEKAQSTEQESAQAPDEKPEQENKETEQTPEKEEDAPKE